MNRFAGRRLRHAYASRTRRTASILNSTFASASRASGLLKHPISVSTEPAAGQMAGLVGNIALAEASAGAAACLAVKPCRTGSGAAVCRRASGRLRRGGQRFESPQLHQEVLANRRLHIFPDHHSGSARLCPPPIRKQGPNAFRHAFGQLARRKIRRSLLPA
jgi:hypothetical protein